MNESEIIWVKDVGRSSIATFTNPYNNKTYRLRRCEGVLVSGNTFFYYYLIYNGLVIDGLIELNLLLEHLNKLVYLP